MSAERPPASADIESAQAARDDDQDASLPSSPSQGEINPEDVLRNAPTFVQSEKDDGATPTMEGDNLANPQDTPAPKPGVIEKIMAKLGLNPIMLMSMFKSVCPYDLSLSLSRCNRCHQHINYPC